MSDQLSPKLTSWASTLEPEARLQAERTARLDVVERVALMPDAHYGMGATVGSVIATTDAVIPAAVGVDIGCGMVAAHTHLIAGDLPDDLDRFMPMVERAVPAGVGVGVDRHSSASDLFWAELDKTASPNVAGTLRATAHKQLGSLGSGNHFAEVCLDEDDHVWVMLHSGSRGVGNKLAQIHIKEARAIMKLAAVKLEDPDLAYLLQGTTAFDRYMRDLTWSQEYARMNREVMMTELMAAFGDFLGMRVFERERINAHHNYLARETIEGRELWVTRKGAIRAGVDDRGIIPGSMGTCSYITTGKGSVASLLSCSHGAGRSMSRGAAKKQFTAADLAAQMHGKTWLADRAQSLIDEIPSSYKDIDVVMADQQDLVHVDHTLHQILNYKGC